MMRIGGGGRSGGEWAPSSPVFSIRSGGDCLDSEEAAGNTVVRRRGRGELELYRHRFGIRWRQRGGLDSVRETWPYW